MSQSAISALSAQLEHNRHRREMAFMLDQAYDCIDQLVEAVSVRNEEIDRLRLVVHEWALILVADGRITGNEARAGYGLPEAPEVEAEKEMVA